MSNVIVITLFGHVYCDLNEQNPYIFTGSELSMYTDWSNKQSLMAVVTVFRCGQIWPCQ